MGLVNSQPQQHESECTHGFKPIFCIITQEVREMEKQSGGGLELKIDYRWTDYHNKRRGQRRSNNV